MRHSLRLRVLLGVVVATMLVLAASCLAVYVLMQASLFGEFDAALGAKARAIAALVEQDAGATEEEVSLEDLPEGVRSAIVERARGRPISEIERKQKRGRIVYEVEVRADAEEAEFQLDGGEVPPGHVQDARIGLEFEESSFPEFQRPDRPEYLQLWRAEGTRLYRSPSLEGHELGREAGSLDEPRFESVVLPDGRRGRTVGVTFAPRQEEEGRGTPVRVTLALAKDTVDIDRTLARLRLLLIAVCAGATLVSAGVLAWTVKAGLRPVEALAGQIGSVGEEDLSARVAVAEAPTELLPVVERLNDLLARLEAAFQRERAFSADVAHELRTPLAGLRSTLEVALSGKRDLALFEEGLRDSLGISCQMHGMVENLLAMARSEAGQLAVVSEAVPLDELVRECWSALEELATQRGLHVEWRLEPPCVLETDREKLRLILRNILGNAVTYADPHAQVRIESESDDGRVTLRVTNSGSKLSAEQAQHVFERFWRGDAARSDTGVHCGLGLTLCERLTTLLGGSIAAESVLGGEFTITLDLPVGRADPR